MCSSGAEAILIAVSGRSAAWQQKPLTQFNCCPNLGFQNDHFCLNYQYQNNCIHIFTIAFLVTPSYVMSNTGLHSFKKKLKNRLLNRHIAVSRKGFSRKFVNNIMHIFRLGHLPLLFRVGTLSELGKSYADVKPRSSWQKLSLHFVLKDIELTLETLSSLLWLR